MGELIAQTGNYLKPSLLPFLGVCRLTVSLFVPPFYSWRDSITKATLTKRKLGVLVGLLTVGPSVSLTLACSWDSSSSWVALPNLVMKAFASACISLCCVERLSLGGLLYSEEETEGERIWRRGEV